MPAREHWRQTAEGRFVRCHQLNNNGAATGTRIIVQKQFRRIVRRKHAYAAHEQQQKGIGEDEVNMPCSEMAK